MSGDGSWQTTLSPTERIPYGTITGRNTDPRARSELDRERHEHVVAVPEDAVHVPTNLAHAGIELRVDGVVRVELRPNVASWMMNPESKPGSVNIAMAALLSAG